MKNDRKITIERPLKKGNRAIDVGITPFYNGIIIANIAGSLEDLDGQDKRYKQIAKLVQKNKVGTFVRIGNEIPDYLPWPKCCLDDFRYLVDYCYKNGEQLSGKKDPKIYLMGYSAGAGIATVVGSEFTVEKMLIIAPGIDCGRTKIQKSLETYTGEVFITIGKNDYTVGPKTGRAFYKWASNAKVRKLEEINDCTHDFEGEINSQILSKAPLWAFAGDETYPIPQGGIIMYDRGKGPFVPKILITDPVTGKIIEQPISWEEAKI